MNAIWRFCIVVGLLMLEGKRGCRGGICYWEMLREDEGTREGGRVVDVCGGNWRGWMDWMERFRGRDGSCSG
jgi:hypothetical protein